MKKIPSQKQERGEKSLDKMEVHIEDAKVNQCLDQNGGPYGGHESESMPSFSKAHLINANKF